MRLRLEGEGEKRWRNKLGTTIRYRLQGRQASSSERNPIKHGLHAFSCPLQDSAFYNEISLCPCLLLGT